MFSWIFKLLAAGIISSSKNILIVVLVSLHSQGIIISSNNILIVVLVSLICNRKKRGVAPSFDLSCLHYE
jgi:hypothetical protein